MIAIVGCGNRVRGDDGVGCEVVRQLAESPLGADPRIRLLDAATDGMAVMFAARGCDALFLVDACRTGSPAGAIFEIPASEIDMESRHRSLTLHDFRWQHALFAARRMFADDCPQDVVVLLVEAASTDFGLDLSAPVGASVEKIVERVIALAEARLPQDRACVVPSI